MCPASVDHRSSEIRPRDGRSTPGYLSREQVVSSCLDTETGELQRRPRPLETFGTPPMSSRVGFVGNCTRQVGRYGGGLRTDAAALSVGYVEIGGATAKAAACRGFA